MAGSGVTAQSLRGGFLMGLQSAYPALADPSLDIEMADAIAYAESMVGKELGTRFGVTHFLPMQSASAPVALPAGSEYEYPMQWPGCIPGDGYPRLRTRVRPIVDVVSIVLNIPGSLVGQFPIPTDWLRVDRRTRSWSPLPREPLHTPWPRGSAC